MKQPEILKTIKDNFQSKLKSFRTSRDKLLEKIKIRELQIERLKSRLEKLHRTNWTKDLLIPVLDEIKNALPEWDYNKNLLHPMGLSCRVSVFFTKKVKMPSSYYTQVTSITIIFSPGDLENSELFYETGESIERYPPGTIGAINGLNRVTKSLESIKEAVDLLKPQIKTQK